MIRALDLEVSSSPWSPVCVARAVRASGVRGVRAVVPIGVGINTDLTFADQTFADRHLLSRL